MLPRIAFHSFTLIVNAVCYHRRLSRCLINTTTLYMDSLAILLLDAVNNVLRIYYYQEKLQCVQN